MNSVRYLLIIFLVVASQFSQAQEQQEFYVVSFRGAANLKEGIVQKGDKLSLTDLGRIDFREQNASIILFNRGTGYIKLDNGNIQKLKNQKISTRDALLSALSLKSSQKSLYSRGDCACIDPKVCFSTDISLNDFIMIMDSATFESLGRKDENVAYFVQFRQGEKVHTKVLNKTGALYSIKKEDFMVSDSLFNFETPAKIGLVRENGGRKTYETIAVVKFTFPCETELRELFNTTSRLMGNVSKAEIFEAFYQAIYLQYGKPYSICELIKFSNNTIP